MMHWDAAKDARLRTEWATGDKTEVIALTLSAEFGVSLSKGSIIGRAHKMDLPRRKPANSDRWTQLPDAQSRYEALMEHMGPRGWETMKMHRRERAGDGDLDWSSLVEG